MADYLVLRKTGEETEIGSWSILKKVDGKTADATGQLEALRESYEGPGRYAILRADQARTGTIEANPSLTEDSPSPNWS